MHLSKKISMPKHEETIKLSISDKDTTLAIGYQAIKNLGWTVLFAGEEKLVGSTPKKWSSLGQQILIETNGSSLTVSSEMVNNESFDVGGKNKKNVAEILTAFAAAQNTADAATIESNINAIEGLRELTIKTAAEEAANAAEVDAAMNLSGSNLYLTYGIIAINVLVFALMTMNGAGIMEVNSIVHIKWGSNFSPLTLSGDWWRLLTNVFIHFGIIHLAMNMYCLYTVGVYLEPMLGKIKYITAYLCTGILASLVSLWWHKEGVNSAGASGAIFGMYGLFLALLITNLIPKQVRNALLQSIVVFIAYNLIYGMKSGVDNSAHIGGLISGFIFGTIYAFGIKKEKQEQAATWILPLVILATLAAGYQYLQMNKVSTDQRKAELANIKDASSADYEKYTEQFNAIYVLEDSAVAPLLDTSITYPELKVKIENISYPVWKQVEEKLTLTKGYNVSPALHTKTDNWLAYTQLRKQELDLLLEIINSGNQDGLIDRLDEVRIKMKQVIALLQG